MWKIPIVTTPRFHKKGGLIFSEVMKLKASNIRQSPTKMTPKRSLEHLLMSLEEGEISLEMFHINLPFVELPHFMTPEGKNTFIKNTEAATR